MIIGVKPRWVSKCMKMERFHLCLGNVLTAKQEKYPIQPNLIRNTYFCMDWEVHFTYWDRDSWSFIIIKPDINLPGQDARDDHPPGFGWIKRAPIEVWPRLTRIFGRLSGIWHRLMGNRLDTYTRHAKSNTGTSELVLGKGQVKLLGGKWKHGENLRKSKKLVVGTFILDFSTFNWAKLSNYQG